MNTLPIVIDPDFGCTVVGELHYSDEPDELGQDMVEVTLPNGLLIECGWIPDSDPNGAYTINVMSGLKRLASSGFQTRNVDLAKRKIEELAQGLCGPISVSDASSYRPDKPMAV